MRGSAARVEKANEDNDKLQDLPIVAGKRDRLPLSFAQQRLWFLNQLQPESSFYNVALATQISGTLDVAALARALDTIVTRHEALRTVFDTVDDEPVQPRRELRPATELLQPNTHLREGLLRGVVSVVRIAQDVARYRRRASRDAGSLGFWILDFGAQLAMLRWVFDER